MRIKKGMLILLSFVLLLPGFPVRGLADELPQKELTEEDQLIVHDFESVSDWRGLVPEQETVHEGSSAGRWNITDRSNGKMIKAIETSAIPHNWSSFDTLNLWIYSEKATNDRIYAVLYSDEPSTSQTDYYITSISMTWEGWKKVSIPFYSFRSGYSPAGFQKIDQLRFHTSWYGETPNPETQLVLDHMTLDYSKESDILPIDGFEDARKWSSVTESSEHVKEGLYSGRWANMPVKKAVQTTAIPADWSRYDKLEFWLYSKKATGTMIYPILDSDDPETEGFDYYMSGIKIDWTGWKLVSLPLKDFTPSRQPLGLHSVKKLTFHSYWYSDKPPSADTEVYFDDLRLIRESFQVSPKTIEKSGPPGSEQVYYVTVLNKAAAADHYEAVVPEEHAQEISIDAPSGDLLPGESRRIAVRWKWPDGQPEGGEESVTISIISRLKLGASFQVKLKSKSVKWEPALHERPKSFISKAELTAARTRVAEEQWAGLYDKKLKEQADGLVMSQLQVPDTAGGHGMWFLCDDSSRLDYDASSPHKHYCPSEDRYYEGESYDAGWRYYRHNEIIKAARTLAAAYALSGEERYGKKAAGILLDYAAIYPNYQKQARGGRLYWQTLDEAVSMVDLAYTYDLLYGSGFLEDEDKANIELNLLRPSAVAISEYDMGRSNWQAWHNAAVGMIGFVLGDREYMEFAVNGEHGFHYLMNESVLSDGFWWEGSIAYHLYALRALQHLADGAKSWGYDLFGNPNFKKMYDLPLDYAYPNLALPFNNDGGIYGSSLIDSVSAKGNFDYEPAFTAYRTKSYAWLLDVKYQKLPREGEYALFKGAPEIPKDGSYTWKSRNFEGAGQSVLRNSSMYVLMDYGPYGGSHGHPDKLHIDLFADGEAFAPDFGTPSYGHVLYTGWYKQSISHNTLIVDGVSQKAVEGRLEQFAAGKKLQLMRGDAGEVYPGTKIKRTILLHGRYAVDWMEAESPGTIRQYDWVFHGLGAFSNSLKLSDRHSPLGSQNGYQFLTGPKSAFVQDDFKADWKWNNKELQMVSLGTGLREAAVAMGPGPSSEPETSYPVLIERQNGEAASFVHVFGAGGKEFRAEWFDDKGIKISDEEGITCLTGDFTAKEGELLAGSVALHPEQADSCREVPVKILSANQNLTIILPEEQKVKSASLFIQGTGFTNITVNGKRVSGVEMDGVTVIER
ncbi:hypothetical protein GKZ89_06400 [Bacillus mangrovi]|uniref:Alginate lyase domain-containing protein n=1 Tax=Metabacillus mangrovi TaxID=1491830 RepID=A0A7X2V3U3_9BACI|nr:heparinase II/III family protein [Metabacillus mangrovi]MTH53037.1 hypothetical protein [Metabacillus mangrovi]